MKKTLGFLLFLSYVSLLSAQDVSVKAAPPAPTDPRERISRSDRFVFRGDDGSTQTSIYSFSADTVAQPQAACTGNATTLCLLGGRFKVQVAWRVLSQGTSGAGQAVSVTSDTGYFWFFSASNIELVLKVLDGRAFNNAIWVFFGALSDVEYTITVTDLVTGDVKTYTNAQGTLASVADTSAFSSASNCNYSISTPGSSVGVAGGPGSVGVVVPGGCRWIATSNDSWITINSGTPGNGNGTVAFSVAPNSGGLRTGTLTVAGQTFTVTQSGSFAGLYNGSWSGVTSQGKAISFTIASDAFTKFSIAFAGTGCLIETGSTLTFVTPKPLTGDTFTIAITGAPPSSLSFTVNGTFNSATSASGSGSFTFSQTSPLPSCSASGSATWTATKS